MEVTAEGVPETGDAAAPSPLATIVAPVATEEVAAAVGWLCLPSSGAVTGQSIPVAGGEVM